MPKPPPFDDALVDKALLEEESYNFDTTEKMGCPWATRRTEPRRRKTHAAIYQA